MDKIDTIDRQINEVCDLADMRRASGQVEDIEVSAAAMVTQALGVMRHRAAADLARQRQAEDTARDLRRRAADILRRTIRDAYDPREGIDPAALVEGLTVDHVRETCRTAAAREQGAYIVTASYDDLALGAIGITATLDDDWTMTLGRRYYDGYDLLISQGPYVAIRKYGTDDQDTTRNYTDDLAEALAEAYAIRDAELRREVGDGITPKKDDSTPPIPGIITPIGRAMGALTAGDPDQAVALAAISIAQALAQIANSQNVLASTVYHD